MIRLPDEQLSAASQRQLDEWQRDINAIPDYAGRVAAAKRRFDSRNNKRNATFRAVRTTLASMCGNTRHCHYCEDSCADEVEHIKPKDLYPEAVFVWENYLYACGPCNGSHKNNQFAVFSAQQLVEVTRGQHDPVVPPEPGDPVLINPRDEDPLRFMELDLMGTFLFLPCPAISARDQERAHYTIAVLDLNREPLRKTREGACVGYTALLEQYITRRNRGAPQSNPDSLRAALQNMRHPTVWKEMQRQSALLPELNDLFTQAPEALSW